MSIDLNDILTQPLVMRLGTLAAFLKKGEEWARANGVSEEDMLGSRLAPDMHPLSRQIQIASDSAKGGVARVAGIEAPVMPDTETTFAELQERLAKTIAFVQSVPADAISGKEATEVVLPIPGNEMRFSALDFVRAFVLPNTYFHASIAYALMRMRGVPLGKMDYLRGS